MQELRETESQATEDKQAASKMPIEPRFLNGWCSAKKYNSY